MRSGRPFTLAMMFGVLACGPAGVQRLGEDGGVVHDGGVAERVRQTFKPLPSDVDVPNPERGFYKWFTEDVLAGWEDTALDGVHAAGYRLVHFPVNLNAYRAQSLP